MGFSLQCVYQWLKWPKARHLAAPAMAGATVHQGWRYDPSTTVQITYIPPPPRQAGHWAGDRVGPWVLYIWPHWRNVLARTVQHSTNHRYPPSPANLGRRPCWASPLAFGSSKKILHIKENIREKHKGVDHILRGVYKKYVHMLFPRGTHPQNLLLILWNWLILKEHLQAIWRDVNVWWVL